MFQTHLILNIYLYNSKTLIKTLNIIQNLNSFIILYLHHQLTSITNYSNLLINSYYLVNISMV